MHGALGYTWEQDVHIWMRRAWSLAQAWGNTRFHQNRVGDAVIDETLPAEQLRIHAGDGDEETRERLRVALRGRFEEKTE